MRGSTSVRSRASRTCISGTCRTWRRSRASPKTSCASTCAGARTCGRSRAGAFHSWRPSTLAAVRGSPAFQPVLRLRTCAGSTSMAAMGFHGTKTRPTPSTPFSRPPRTSRRCHSSIVLGSKACDYRNKTARLALLRLATRDSRSGISKSSSSAAAPASSRCPSFAVIAGCTISTCAGVRSWRQCPRFPSASTAACRRASARSTPPAAIRCGRSSASTSAGCTAARARPRSASRRRRGRR